MDWFCRSRFKHYCTRITGYVFVFCSNFNSCWEVQDSRFTEYKIHYRYVNHG